MVVEDGDSGGGGGEGGEKSGKNSSKAKKAFGLRGSGPSTWWTNFHRDLMAGAVMGGVMHTIVAPVERAKLLLQTQESNIAILSGPHRRFKGMIDCIARTVREEGILSLWRGNGSSVIRYYPSVALNFSLKESVPDLLHHLNMAKSLTLTYDDSHKDEWKQGLEQGTWHKAVALEFWAMALACKRLLDMSLWTNT